MNCRVTWEIISTGNFTLEFTKECGCYIGFKQSRPYQKNTELFDFDLGAEDMDLINALDRNEKDDWY